MISMVASSPGPTQFSMLHVAPVFQRATLKNWVGPGDEAIIL